MFSQRRSVLFQYFYVTSGILGTLIAGIVMGWSATEVPKLIAGELGFKITSGEGGWMVSLLYVGHICASILVAYMLDRIGRRWTSILAMIPHIIGWACLQYAWNVKILYLGRLLGGFGMGISSAVGIILAGELPDKTTRGAISFGNKMVSSIGQVISFTVGAYMSYHGAIYFHAALTTLVMLQSYVLLPESPYFLMKNGDRDESERVLMKLRGTNQSKFIQEELDIIELTVKHDMINNSSWRELFTKPLNRKTLMINSVLRIFHYSSGYFIITSYVYSILVQSGLEISPNIATIGYGTAMFIFMSLSSLVVDRIGRKPLLIASFFGIGIALSSIGNFFFLQDKSIISLEALDKIRWIPLCGLILFCFSFSVGVGPVQNVLAGEMFATNIKVKAITVCNILGSIANVGLTKAYQLTGDAWGVHVPFWALALSMVFGAFFTMKFLPETKNKTFLEIQAKIHEL